MEVDKNSVGTRINEIRKEKGLTLKEFGKKVDNAGKSVVSKWERGLTIPNNKRLKLIAEIGEITVDELLYGKRNTIINTAIHDSLNEFLDWNKTKQNNSDYKNNKKRYENLLKALFERYSEYGEHILPTDDLYIQIRRWTTNELEIEYLKGARTNESSILYLKSILEDAHVTVSKYEYDPLTQEAIKNGDISKEVFDFVIKNLIDLKLDLNNRLNEIKQDK